MYPTPVKSLFENTMGNPFLDFLKYCMEIFKKKFIYIYRYSYFKFAFRINFQLWEVVELKIRKYANLCIFSLTTSGRKLILKADSK